MAININAFRKLKRRYAIAGLIGVTSIAIMLLRYVVVPAYPVKQPGVVVVTGKYRMCACVCVAN